ncbi:MAG: response regulator, partial [Rhodospirillaceae bacterium]|nr:response regulator [Rhodospirillaceae bacterium]
MTGEIKLNDKSRHTVLIVDDETINIKILSDLLKDDMQVLFATNGEDGISTAHKSHPDLILLDIMMPGMDGYEVCRRLKTNPKT